jgi:hypothetical protein
MSRVNGSQRFDAVRYSLSLIEGNWWSRSPNGLLPRHAVLPVIMARFGLLSAGDSAERFASRAVRRHGQLMVYSIYT